MQVIFLELGNLGCLVDDRAMRYFHEQLRRHMENLTPPIKYHDLQFLAGIPSSVFSGWKKPEGHKYYRSPSDAEIEKLAAVQCLGLTVTRLKGWRLIDNEGPEAVISAIKEIQDARGI
jgi:hypothetical protein